MNALRSGDPTLLGAALSNDLQPAALDLQPRLRTVLQTGLEYGAWAPGVGIRSDLRVPGGRASPPRSTSLYRSVPRGCAGQSGARPARSSVPASSD